VKEERPINCCIERKKKKKKKKNCVNMSFVHQIEEIFIFKNNNNKKQDLA